ncbi:MAG: L,D-transpeptidase [Candidatus Berkiella sp.]
MYKSFITIFMFAAMSFLFSTSAFATRVIRVDLGSQTFKAYDDDGRLVRTGHVSGGKNYCPDIGRGCKTVTGTFTIYTKKGAGCKSSRFPVGKGGAPMPYCMFFKGGYALHGSYHVPNYNASHGCVRMSPADAKWLNLNFVRVGSTRVKVSY